MRDFAAPLTSTLLFCGVMKLNGTPDGSTRDSDEEAEVLEDDLVILDDDQAEQFLQQLQQGNGAAPEEEEEEAEEADEEMECEADGAVGDVPDDSLTVFRSHTSESARLYRLDDCFNVNTEINSVC